MPQEEDEVGGGFAPSPERPVGDRSYGTYDEVSMHQSRDFLMALQELKNLRPQLYSAAEYCESSYLFSDQKQIVLDNLKDYSVKALVNAVDHLGTVAFKLNDLLNQQVYEIHCSEICSSSLAQRLRSCQEHSDREGLKQQSLAKSTQANHKHYILPDEADFTPGATDQELVVLRETFDPEQVQSQAQIADGLSTSRNLAWHFAVDRSPAKVVNCSSVNQSSSSRYGASPIAKNLEASLLSQDSDSSNKSSVSLGVPDWARLGSRSRTSERAKSVERSRSVEKSRPADKMKSFKIPGRSQSTERRPSKVSTPNGKVSSLERTRSFLHLSDLDKEREIQASISRSKSLLRSLLGRGKNGKPVA